jgi:hypothetical protein
LHLQRKAGAEPAAEEKAEIAKRERRIFQSAVPGRIAPILCRDPASGLPLCDIDGTEEP